MIDFSSFEIDYNEMTEKDLDIFSTVFFANYHSNLYNNPHSVNKTQIGLSNVQNYATASKAEAEAGTSSLRYMTPLRTKEAILALAPSGGDEVTEYSFDSSQNLPSWMSSSLNVSGEDYLTINITGKTLIRLTGDIDTVGLFGSRPLRVNFSGEGNCVLFWNSSGMFQNQVRVSGFFFIFDTDGGSLLGSSLDIRGADLIFSVFGYSPHPTLAVGTVLILQ
jgi:hypothetical protein